MGGETEIWRKEDGDGNGNGEMMQMGRDEDGNLCLYL